MDLPLETKELHVYTENPPLSISSEVTLPSLSIKSQIRSESDHSPRAYVDRLPQIPAELQSTTKFYAYLHSLGQPSNPECPCSQVHPAPHQLPRLLLHSSSPSPSQSPSQPAVTISNQLYELSKINCELCQGIVPPLAIHSIQINHLHAIVAQLKLQNHELILQSESLLVYSDEIRLVRLKSENAQLRTENERLKEDNQRLDQMNERLNGEINSVHGMFVRVKSDMEAMGEKLLDEIEVRAEHSKEMLQEEVEDLSKSLFEEANTMVSDEKRKLRGVEVSELELRKELKEVKEAWVVDLNQLNELRDKLRDSTLTSTDGYLMDRSLPSQASKSIVKISRPHLQAFACFLDQINNTALTSLISLPYLKHVIEFEVELTLNFNLNASSTTQVVNSLASPTTQSTSARINVKKLLDHITKNTCYVERIPTKRDSMDSEAGSLASMGTIGSVGSMVSVTRGIFIRSLSERVGLFASSFQSTPTNTQLSARFSPDADINTTTIDPIHEHTQCTTCLIRSKKTHHFKLSQNPTEEFLEICSNCRIKLVSVCEFWGFLRGAKSGVFREMDIEVVFEKFAGVRAEMFWARAGICTRMDSELGYTRDTSQLLQTTTGPTAIVDDLLQSHGLIRSPDLQNDQEENAADCDIAFSSPVETFGLHHFKM